MKQQEFKSFAELYTDIIRCVADKSDTSVDVVLNRLRDKECAIRNEYENTLIMDELYYIQKFL